MNLKTRRLIIGLIAAMLVLFGTTNSSLAAEVESPVTCVEGSEPLMLAYGQHTSGCSINPATDIDRFTFNGAAGDKVRINVYGPTAFFDTTLELRDPVGSVINSSSCTGGTSGCSLSVTQILPASGDYFISISDSGVNEVGSFTLQIERLVPPLDLQHLDYGSSSVDALNQATDIDQYNIYGSVGTDIRIAVDGTTAFLDATIEVRDPNGLLIKGPADGATCAGGTSGCSFVVDISPAINGNYSVIIYDGGINNTGNYQIGLWCMFGSCDSDGDLNPDPAPPLLSYVIPIIDTFTHNVDAGFYRYNATVGTDIRIAVDGTTAFTDPRLEIRDPNGNVVISPADGTTCTGGTSGCSFAVDFSPVVNGTHSIVIFDGGVNETGNYQIALWCLYGDCDSDEDGIVDGYREPINYGGFAIHQINPNVDGDFFMFAGNAGDDVRINVLGTTAFFDPSIEVRDPSGDVILGPADGAACAGGTSGCSFSVDITVPLTGTYYVVLYDGGVNEIGNYQFSLQCLFGSCPNVTPPPVSDNCSIVSNPGQIDTDNDGHGNICDGDFDNDCVVGFLDLGIFKDGFFGSDPELDLDSDGTVAFLDLGLFKGLFFGTPGPSAPGSLCNPNNI